MAQKFIYLIEPKSYTEEFLRDNPKLEEVVNVHIDISTGSILLKHQPIKGLVIHMYWTKDQIDNYIKTLSIAWVQPIKYLRICQEDKLYCVIYKDKISIPHSTIKQFKLAKIKNAHFRKLCEPDRFPNYLYSDPPKVVRDLDQQLKNEGSKVLSTTLIRVPDYLWTPTSNLYTSKYKIVTPLWLTYLTLSRTYIEITRNDETHYFFARDNPFSNYFPDMLYSSLTLKEVLYRYITVSKSFIYKHQQWIDEVYLALLEVETIVMGRSIGCHI
jgi:hypothetical protein